MRVYDTQIISYDFKDQWPDGCESGFISSITGLEFLLVQSTKPTQAHYYVPLPKRLAIHPGIVPAARDHPFSKNSTDQILVEFAGEFPAYVEFSNLALSQVINDNLREIFYAATDFLPKDKRKVVRSRFAYLVSRHISCIPLSQASLANALELLDRFSARFNPKAHFRNTFNDILILATARNNSAELITSDSTLSRFASRIYEVPIAGVCDRVLLDFSQVAAAVPKRSRESKGYINRGWQFHFRNYVQKVTDRLGS
jgi:hypothetical protein